MMTGEAPPPLPAVSSVAMTTADSGNPSTAANAAPIPTPTAGVSANPGRGDAIMPAAAPRNKAGNTGPPRKPPIEIDHASPLKAISSASAESDHAPGFPTSDGSATSPENSTSLTLLSAASEKAIARPEIASPASGSNTNSRDAT